MKLVKKSPTGMFAFSIIWAGQLVSVLGTAMTQFALMIWVWDRTHQVTPTVLMGFFEFAPLLIMTPLAGALVDRWNRKKMMIIGDLIAGIGSVVILLLYSSSILQIWHLYLIGLFVGAFGAFQYPAYSAAISMLVDKKHYVRANSMMSIVGSASDIFAPPLAAVLLVVIGVKGILIIDIISFCVAIGVLLPIHIPQPEKTIKKKGVTGLWKDSIFGFKYVYAIKPLLLILLMYSMLNFIDNIGGNAFRFMVLARTSDNQAILGLVLGAMGVGSLVGGIAASVWGGPKKRMRLLLILNFFALIWATTVIFSSPYIWAAGVFIVAITIPLANGCSQGFWQAKISPKIQGRVFAARRFIALILTLFSTLLAGPLADRIFEPAMMPGGTLTHAFGWLIYPQVGAGLTLLVFLSFLISVIIALLAFSVRSIRDADDVVPDYDRKNENKIKDNRMNSDTNYKKGETGGKMQSPTK